MSEPHGPEIGRPRYQSPAAGGPVAPGMRGPGPSSAEGPQGTANAAVGAIIVASVGWAVPILGGVAAIRRGNAALRAIAGSGGALEGVGLALWARRLGWLYVVAWSGLLFVWLGGAGIQLLYVLIRHVF